MALFALFHGQFELDGHTRRSYITRYVNANRSLPHRPHRPFPSSTSNASMALMSLNRFFWAASIFFVHCSMRAGSAASTSAWYDFRSSWRSGISLSYFRLRDRTAGGQFGVCSGLGDDAHSW